MSVWSGKRRLPRTRGGSPATAPGGETCKHAAAWVAHALRYLHHAVQLDELGGLQVLQALQHKLVGNGGDEVEHEPAPQVMPCHSGRVELRSSIFSENSGTKIYQQVNNEERINHILPVEQLACRQVQERRK